MFEILALLFAVMPTRGMVISASDAGASVPTENRLQDTVVSLAGAVTDELPLMPGWPVKVSSDPQFGPSRGVALADLDGDGRLEVIRASTANQLHVWKYDGTPFPGWPKTLTGMGQYAAAVADVDLDGQYEIGVTTRGMTSGGRVYLFAPNGTVKPGWPYSGLVGGNFEDAPTFADLDDDDTLEVIVGERNYPIGHLHVLDHRGRPFPGAWPCSLDHVPATGAAVGDINLDGIKEIVYCSYTSIYVFRPDGTSLPGWPQVNPTGRYFSYQSPALADLDGDDTLEIVAGMHRNGACCVWRYDGTMLAGWPRPFSRWTYCPPTTADLYRNGDLKVLDGLAGIMGASADVLYAFDDDGSDLPGFPYRDPDGGSAEGDIAVADLDGDHDMEIIFTSNLVTNADTAGYLHALHHNGTVVTGWPLRPKGFTYLNGASVADVDGDDSLDIIAVSAYSNFMWVHIWETGVPFNRMTWEWPT
ncbi:MAG: VCBS repeat-containing protein, partial [candidate division WOR-3 bacterium]